MTNYKGWTDEEFLSRLEDCRNWTDEEFIKNVTNADMWDDFEPEVYEYFLDQVGLDYKSFDDPDAMWEAYLNKLN